MIYLDSSILVEAYLGQVREAEARQILADPSVKVASWLLSVEVPIALRRAMRGARDSRRLAAKLARFDEDLDGVTLYDDPAGVARIVRRDVRLSRCRAIDAVHAATALLLAEEAGAAVTMTTFDRRLAETARAVGIPVMP